MFNKKNITIISISLLITSYIIICIFGNTITIKRPFYGLNSIDDINITIEQDNNSIEIIDKKYSDNIVYVKIKSKEKGKAYIDFITDKLSSTEAIYVHNFGIITVNQFFGKSNGDIVIPISVLIIELLIIISLINKYKKSINKNLYDYKNVVYLGLILFLINSFLNLLVKTFNYGGLIDSIGYVINTVESFSYLLLPIAFITSILVTISNSILIKKEGFSYRNTLGTILGILFIVLTLLPGVLNYVIQKPQFVEFHNESGILLYIYRFVEASIFVIVSYLECILIGTIVLSVKAAKKVPSFDKDYIIILGCMIKKDGSLTPLLKSRVDRAIEFYNLQKEKTGKELIFISSGGKGNDEPISEAEAIKNYLIDKGIKSKNILIEDKSTNTYENIKNSYKLINDKKSKIAYSTTNYHVFRAGVIASNQKLYISGIGSKTKRYFWINAFVREFIATLYTERKKHVKILLIIMILVIIMIALMYLSVIL